MKWKENSPLECVTFVIFRTGAVYNTEMNNCDLEKLSVSGVKLEPSFTPDVTRYQARVPSQVTRVSVDAWTSDAGATWTLLVRFSLFCISFSCTHESRDSIAVSEQTLRVMYGKCLI